MQSGRGGEAEPPQQRQPASAPASAPARQQPEPKPAVAVRAGSESSRAVSADLERLRSMWPTLLERMHERKAATAAYLSQASPVSLRGADPAQVVIGFPKGCEFHLKAVSERQTQQLIEQTLGELLGSPVACRFEAVDSLPGQAAAAAEKAEPAAPPVDPTYLNSVLELFEGRVLPGQG